MEIFCERLKELRQEKGLGSRALGNIIGVNGTTICRWENGTSLPNIEELRSLAVFFGVTADYLIGLEN